VERNPPPNISTSPQFFALFKLFLAACSLSSVLNPTSIASLL